MRIDKKPNYCSAFMADSFYRIPDMHYVRQEDDERGLIYFTILLTQRGDAFPPFDMYINDEGTVFFPLKAVSAMLGLGRIRNIRRFCNCYDLDFETAALPMRRKDGIWQTMRAITLEGVQAMLYQMGRQGDVDRYVAMFFTHVATRLAILEGNAVMERAHLHRENLKYFLQMDDQRYHVFSLSCAADRAEAKVKRYDAMVTQILEVAKAIEEERAKDVAAQSNALAMHRLCPTTEAMNQ